MYLGYYKDPKNRIEITPKEKIKNPKIGCIMPVYVGSQARTEYNATNEDGKTEGGWVEDKLESIKFTLECFKKFKTNLNYEIILVNNGTEDENALNYYYSTGLKIVHRENDGFSFGAYKYFWDNFGSNHQYDFDYYLFFEADYCPCKDYWLEELLEEFNKADDIGAVGNVLETRGLQNHGACIPVLCEKPEEAIQRYFDLLNIDRGWNCNFDGCYTFTSKKILEEVDKYGKGLRYIRCDGGKTISQQWMATSNELLFQQPILELGYCIAAFGYPKFEECDRIFFYGIRSGSLSRKFDETKLVPIVNGNTRTTCPQMKEYFYEKLGR